MIYSNLGAFGSGGSRWGFVTVPVLIHWFWTRKLSLVRRIKANTSTRPHVHTYPTHIRFITQDSSGNIGNWACVEVAILNTILTVQLTLAYSNLASTRFPVHSVFKNFHYGERIRVDESQIRKYVWTKVQYSIFIKSPLRGSSDLIYKIEQRKKKEKKTNLQI